MDGILFTQAHSMELAAMIGKAWLRVKHATQSDGLLERVWQALLYLASECESLVVRPNGPNHWRRAFLRSKGVRYELPCYFGNGLRLYKAADLVISRRACFGENCGIYVHAPVSIGEDFLAAP